MRASLKLSTVFELSAVAGVLELDVPLTSDLEIFKLLNRSSKLNVSISGLFLHIMVCMFHSGERLLRNFWFTSS
ncbi:hypothetical protein Tco_0721042 [Tanacetum coccineum]